MPNDGELGVRERDEEGEEEKDEEEEDVEEEVASEYARLFLAVLPAHLAALPTLPAALLLPPSSLPPTLPAQVTQRLPPQSLPPLPVWPALSHAVTEVSARVGTASGMTARLARVLLTCLRRGLWRHL